MNRREKRKYLKNCKKQLKGLNFTRAQKNAYANFKLLEATSPPLLEGDKVKINYEQVVQRPDYLNKEVDFKDTIESLKDKICTIEYDENFNKSSPYLVCLKEDTHNPKWLFARTDLIKIENNDEQGDLDTNE